MSAVDRAHALNLGGEDDSDDDSASDDEVDSEAAAAAAGSSSSSCDDDDEEEEEEDPRVNPRLVRAGLRQQATELSRSARNLQLAAAAAAARE